MQSNLNMEEVYMCNKKKQTHTQTHCTWSVSVKTSVVVLQYMVYPQYVIYMDKQLSKCNTAAQATLLDSGQSYFLAAIDSGWQQHNDA